MKYVHKVSKKSTVVFVFSIQAAWATSFRHWVCADGTDMPSVLGDSLLIKLAHDLKTVFTCRDDAVVEANKRHSGGAHQSALGIMTDDERQVLE